MENFELIEKYLLNNLSPKERADFELRLKTDDSLRAEKEDMEGLIIGLESHGLKQSLGKRKIGTVLHKEENDTSKTNSNVIKLDSKKRFSFRPLAIAASMFAILAIGWWAFQGSNSSTGYDDIFFSDPGLPTPMSETTMYDFYDAMVDYKMEKYDLAIEKWNGINVGIGSDTLGYYKAMANLQLDNQILAKSLLESLPVESKLYHKAQWYLSKILIEENRIEEARFIIEALPNDPMYNKEDLLELLNR